MWYVLVVLVGVGSIAKLFFFVFFSGKLRVEG